MFCPLIKDECKEKDCKWCMNDGSCAIASLGCIQDRLYELVNAIWSK
jgi:uncharacterized protein CbrC (UPF0167 family)